MVYKGIFFTLLKDLKNKYFGYDEIVLKRKNRYYLFGLSLGMGIFAKNYLQMSKLWLFTAFIPYFLLKVHDYKNTSYSEIENFYKYSLEVRSARERFYQKQENIVKELKTIDEEKFNLIQNQLNNSQITLFEVMNELDKQYLEI